MLVWKTSLCAKINMQSLRQFGDYRIPNVVYLHNHFARGDQVGRWADSDVVAYDYSERIFRWPVRFIDSYQGFAILAFPPGSSEEEISAGYDFDGDGFSNLEEFGFGTDPARPEDNPSQIVLPEIVDGYCVLVIQKRPFTGGRLDYYAESSTDGGATWQRVTSDDPDWVITFDNEAVFEVRSAAPFNASPCKLRARVQFAD